MTTFLCFLYLVMFISLPALNKQTVNFFLSLGVFILVWIVMGNIFTVFYGFEKGIVYWVKYGPFVGFIVAILVSLHLNKEQL